MPGPEPSIDNESATVSNSDQWVRSQVERLATVQAHWSDPDYKPLRVMSTTQWKQVEDFVASLRLSRRPVLYAMKRGEVNLPGGFGGFGKRRNVDILYVVFRDSAHRYAWRGAPYKAERLVMRGDDLLVADPGGVPYDGVLMLRETSDRHALPAVTLHAPDSSAGDAFRALHMQYAGTGLPGRVVTPEGRVWTLPPKPQEPKAVNQPRAHRPEPEQRLVRDAREAELLAGDWVRWMGFPDADVTPVGADGGLDVVGADVVAQVKFEAVKTGRPVLQALYGAGHARGATYWMFFSSAGYTIQALTWAEEVGMALFRFALDGGIEPVSHEAERFYHRTKKYGTAIWPLPPGYST